MKKNIDEIVTLKLPRLMVGQILVGLRERQASWIQIAKTGNTEEPIYLEDCPSISKAQSMAVYYDIVIKQIEEQIK